MVGVPETRSLCRAGPGRPRARLPTTLRVEARREAVRQPFDEKGDRNDRAMFQHYVVEILQTLDGRDDVDANDLASLEWTYLPVLTHSRRPAKVLVNASGNNPTCSSI